MILYILLNIDMRLAISFLCKYRVENNIMHSILLKIKTIDKILLFINVELH